MKRILSSPVTHFNVLIIGFFILVGVMHNHYHHQIEEDVHGYVRKCYWLSKLWLCKWWKVPTGEQVS